MVNNDIKTTSSYILNSLNNFNLLHFKKNTKVVKFVLFSELLYLLIQQSRNYNKLYHQLVLQIEMIKKKLFLNIKDRVILLSNHKKMKILMLKFKLHNIDYDNFIKNIFFAKKDAIYFLYRFIRKHKSFKGDQNLIHFVKILQNEVNNNNIYLKYIYLRKLNIYLKHFTINKIKDVNNFFFPIIFNLLKKETHRIKLRSIIKKLINSYLFQGLNLELSRQKLQSALLKYFKISSKYNIRILPYVEEIHLKDRKQIKKKSDIAMSIKNVFNTILKQNHNSNYFKLLKMLKKNKLDNLPFNLLFNVLNNIKLNTLYGFFNLNGLNYNFVNNSKYLLKDCKNNNIDIFNVYKNNDLYVSDKNIYSLMNKNFLDIYTMFNFFNFFSKRKKNNFFLYDSEKQIEYITYSYNKYNYYDLILLQIKKNEINSNEFKNYVIIKKIITYIKKYKTILTSKNKIKKYFSNFYKIKMLGNRKINNMSFSKNILVYFFKNLSNLYTNKSNKFVFYKKGIEINKVENKRYINDSLIIKEIISYLSSYRKISVKVLYKKIRESKNYIVEQLKNINSNYLNVSQYNNVEINKVNINNIYKINNNFNFSMELNKYFLYYKFNNIYKKYFNKLRGIFHTNIHKKNIEININSIYNLNKYKKNNSIINNFYNKIINKIDEYKKLKSSNYLSKFNKKLFSNKVYNFHVENLNLNFENYNQYLLNNNKLLFSSIFNESLINNHKINKEIINFNIYNIIYNSNKFITCFKNNLFIINNRKNVVKEINLNYDLNLFIHKKLNFYEKLLLLSKKNLTFIKKNNYLFINKTDNNLILENKKLNLLELLKVNLFFNQQDMNKIISKTVSYTTTELKKMTKYQMKKKRSKRIY